MLFVIIVKYYHCFVSSLIFGWRTFIDNESEYFSETLAAESLSQYQQPSTPSPTQSLPQPSQHNHSQLPSPNQPQSNPVLVPNNSQLYASQNNHQHKVNQQQKYQQTPQQQPYQAHNNHNNPNNYQSQNYVQQNNIRSTVLQSAHNPSGSVAAPHQNNQPKYYDQYDNYARPNAQSLQYQPQQQHNNNNSNAVYHNNHYSAVDGGRNQYPHHLQQQQQHQQQNRGAGYNNSHYNQMALSYSAAEMPGVGGIGKISDYDPLTDGPRNVPNATRPTSTLIFSSDRGMGE